jgi:hypothetical protein
MNLKKADRSHLNAETEFFSGTLDCEFEKFIAQLRRGIEWFQLELAVKRRELILQCLKVRGRLFVRQIFQLIVVRFDSIKRFVDRMTHHGFIPALVEKFVRPL